MRKLREGSLDFACGGGRVHGNSDKPGLEGCQQLGRLEETSVGLAWLPGGRAMVGGTQGRVGDHIMKSLDHT